MQRASRAWQYMCTFFYYLPELRNKGLFSKGKFSPNDLAKICSMRVTLFLLDNFVYLMFPNLQIPVTCVPTLQVPFSLSKWHFLNEQSSYLMQLNLSVFFIRLSLFVSCSRNLSLPQGLSPWLLLVVFLLLSVFFFCLLYLSQALEDSAQCHSLSLPEALPEIHSVHLIRCLFLAPSALCSYFFHSSGYIVPNPFQSDWVRMGSSSRARTRVQHSGMGSWLGRCSQRIQGSKRMKALSAHTLGGSLFSTSLTVFPSLSQPVPSFDEHKDLVGRL